MTKILSYNCAAWSTTVERIKKHHGTLQTWLERHDVDILCLQETKVSKEDLEHFFQSLLQNLNSCIHLTVKYGDNDHHKVEAAMKSLAVAFRIACSKDSKQKGIPSTKGAM